MTAEPTPEEHDTWQYRRRMVFGAVIFLGLMIVGLTVFGDPTNALHKTVCDNALWAFVGVIGVYIGAPVVDDWLQKKSPKDAV